MEAPISGEYIYKHFSWLKCISSILMRRYTLNKLWELDELPIIVRHRRKLSCYMCYWNKWLELVNQLTRVDVFHNHKSGCISQPYCTGHFICNLIFSTFDIFHLTEIQQCISSFELFTCKGWVCKCPGKGWIFRGF